MPNIAILDLGTNTFHLLIAEENGEILVDEKQPVKIGEKGIEIGVIAIEAYERARVCIGNYKSIWEKYEVIHPIVIATSAFRSARNGVEIANKLNKEFGINVQIIDGNQEAEYIFKGVTKAVNISEPMLIVDIGGGSVEFIIAEGEEIKWKKSFEIGGQRLVERFHFIDPFPQSSFKPFVHFLSESLEELNQVLEKFPTDVLVGSSGAFDTIVDIIFAKQNKEFPFDLASFEFEITDFQSILIDLWFKNREERLKVPGMTPLRVDMIVVACLLIQYLIGKYQFSTLINSKYALKEGVLYSILAKK